MDMLIERDEIVMKTVNMIKLIIYTLRRPYCSEKKLHHRGNMEKLSMYKATLKLLTVSEDSKTYDINFIAGIAVEEPTGGTAAPTATTTVMNHLRDR
jgi:hypothetical protein